MTARFEDVEIGEVISLGVAPVRAEALAAYIAAFSPDSDPADGAPDGMVFALWSRLEREATTAAGGKRLGVDALRWMRNPPAGELLRGRMTVMGKDPVGEGRGLVIAQHDLIDEAGRLVFSCLTRAVLPR